MSEMNIKVTWDEFKDNGFLWFVNRFLHLFGYAITVEIDDNGKITNAYPSRCKFRGFDVNSETNGFKKVTEYLKSNISELEKDLQE